VARTREVTLTEKF